MSRSWAPLLGLLGCAEPPVAVTSEGGGVVDTSSGEVPEPSTTGGSTAAASSDGASAGTSTGAASSCALGESRACFDGPPESASVPPCHPGTQTCDAAGEWGPCVGQVLPEPANCATPADEACTGQAACAGAQAWLRDFSVTDEWGAIGASALAIAANGDIVATGTYSGTLEIAGAYHTSESRADIWVARFAPNGTPLWFRGFGGVGEPEAAPGVPASAGNIVFALNGDIVLTTNALVDVDFGFGLTVGEPLDPVVLCLSAEGQVQWARRLVGLTDDPYKTFPLLVAPAGVDRWWLAGTLYNRKVDLGDGPLQSAGWGDILLAQLDEHGNFLWSRRHGDPGHQELRAAAATAGGDLVITGGIEGTLQIGSHTLPSAGLRDAFAARLDAQGTPVWSRRYGDNLWQGGSQVHVAAKTITLVGTFQSTIDLGGGELSFPDETPGEGGAGAIYVARLSLDGTYLWSTALASELGWVTVDSLARGDDGSLVLAGYSGSQMQAAGDVWGNGWGAWFMALAPGGAPRWLQTVDGSTRAAIDTQGAVIGAFYLFDVAEFGGVTVGAPQRGSLVLGKYGP